MSEEQGMMVRPNGGGEQVARRGFGEEAIERRNTAAVVMAERARAEIHAMHVMALQRPRDVLEFRVKLLDHCKRSGFAEAARYKKPQGSKLVDGRWVEQFVEGASIRFVESALAAYGNVLSECSITYEDDEQIQVRVTVRDLESTIAYSDEAIVRKRIEKSRLRKNQVALAQRMNSRGALVYIVEATDDEIANMKASRQSKLLRNLGLRILPVDVVEEAMDLCVATVKTGIGKDPAGEQKRLSDAFHAMGVSPAQLAEYLGHSLAETQPAELAELREIYQTLRDGEASWQDVFAAKRPAAEASAALDRSEADTVPPPTRGVAGAKAALRRTRREPVPPTSSSAPPLPTAPPVGPAREPAITITAQEGVTVGEEPLLPPQTSPDLGQQVHELYKILETILQTPEMIPMTRRQIERLPDSAPDKESLRRQIDRAERLAAEDARAEKEGDA